MSGIPSLGDLLKGLASFFVVALGGAGLGVLWGILTALLTKFTSEVRLVEPLFIFGMAYFSYLVAEMFHLSGKDPTTAWQSLLKCTASFSRIRTGCFISRFAY